MPEATICRRVHAWNEPMPGVIDIHSWQEFEAVVERVAGERGRGDDQERLTARPLAGLPPSTPAAARGAAGAR